MGKYKNKKKSRRYDPLQNGKVEESSSVKTEETKPKKKMNVKGLDAIYEKICNETETIFLPALFDLSRLAGDDLVSVTAIFVYSNKEAGPGALIQKLSHFLVHGSQDVKQVAAGTIRNLSSHGDTYTDGIKQLLKHGLLDPVCNCLAAFPSKPEEDPPSANALALLEQLAHVLYNICEVSPRSVARCAPLLPHLALYACLPASPPAIAATTALLCLTEDNPQACERLQAHISALSTRLAKEGATEDPLALHHNLLLAGVLANLKQCKGAALAASLGFTLNAMTALANGPSALLSRHVHTDETEHSEESAITNYNGKRDRAVMSDDLIEKLNIDSQSPSKMRKIIEEMNADGMTVMEEGNGDVVLNIPDAAEKNKLSSDNACVTPKNFDILQHYFEAYQVAQEVVMRLFEEDYEEDCVKEGPRKGEVEWAADGEVDMAMEDEDWEDEDEEEMGVIGDVCKWAVQNRVLELMLATLQRPTDEVMKVLEGSKFGKDICITLSVCRHRCLRAVEAVVGELSLKDLGGPKTVLHAWKLLNDLSQEQISPEVMEALAGAMGALVRKLSAEDLSGMSTDEVLGRMSSMCNVVSNCAAEGVLVDVVSMLSHLGQIVVGVAQSPEFLVDDAKVFEVLKKCTECLLFTAGIDTRLHVAAACIDALVDLYTEDTTDKLAFKLGLCEGLRRVSECFMTKYKLKGNKGLRHKVTIDTVADNLPGFLKYKQVRVNNVDPNHKHAPKNFKNKKSRAK